MFAAIDDARRFYDGLSGQIASVDTTSPAKAEVLAALLEVDQALAAFERALHEGINKKGSKLARSAHRRMKASANGLKTAAQGLTA
jgi:hypothetical protein